MGRYRREAIAGATWFVTLVSHERRPVLIEPAVRVALRGALHKVRRRLPFHINAIVLLPDHLHCVVTLPPGDAALALRISMIKRLTSQAVRDHVPVLDETRLKRRELGLWQRRYWEHRIRDETDFERHVDYVHWNPVKHQWVGCVAEWPFSSFHRYAARGIYPPDWGGAVSMPEHDWGEPG